MKSNEYVIITLKDGFVYKARRFMQKIAYGVFGPETMTKVYFRILLGRELNLDAPKTFNEKICYYKLYYCAKNERIAKCADKYWVRDYLTAKGYADNLIDLLGVWDEPEDIEWDQLPEKFALKRSNGCGYNIICTNKCGVNEKDVKKLLKKWQKDKFGKYNVEPHYDILPSKIICEKYINSEGRLPVDYKIHCCNGKSKYVMVCDGRVRGRTNFYYYDMNGKILDVETDGSSKPFDLDEKLFHEMIRISDDIAQDFPFVRVDFYIDNNKLMIGELTFTPTAGYDYTLSCKGDEMIGKMFQIEDWR